MNPQEALEFLDQVSQQVPMVHSDQERVGASLVILQRLLANQEVPGATPQDAIAVLDHVAKSVPLVRADYIKGRQAVIALANHFAPAEEVQPEEAADPVQEPPQKSRRRSQRK